MDLGIILAAGRSERFGSENKLLADLGDLPLIAHAHRTLVQIVPRCLVVVGERAVAEACPGAEPILIDNRETGQSASLHAGIQAAMDAGAERALVVLGDMPFVTSNHLLQVLAAGVEGAAASTDGLRPMPPAAFPAEWFPPLLALRGDRGAGPLLRSLPPQSLFPLDRKTALDVDTPEALERARRNIAR